jgi:hypothetical protein
MYNSKQLRILISLLLAFSFLLMTINGCGSGIIDLSGGSSSQSDS